MNSRRLTASPKALNCTLHVAVPDGHRRAMAVV